MFLLVDAYRSRRVLPPCAVQLLDGLAFPFFVATLIGVDRVLVTTMRPCRLQQQRQRCGPTATGVGVSLFAALAVVVYARAALVPPSRTWIVAVQAVFVTWSLALFFLVVGRCCELRRTARRADAVRSLLAAYVRLKRHLANGSENSAGSGCGSATAAARRPATAAEADRDRLVRRRVPDDVDAPQEPGSVGCCEFVVVFHRLRAFHRLIPRHPVPP